MRKNSSFIDRRKITRAKNNLRPKAVADTVKTSRALHYAILGVMFMAVILGVLWVLRMAYAAAGGYVR